MNKTAWLMAFLITSSATAALAIATWRRWTYEPTLPPVPRTAETIADVELQNILNKIREGDLHAIGGDLAAAQRAWSEALLRGEGLWQIHEGVGDSYARADLTPQAIRQYAKAEPLVPRGMESNLDAIRYKRAMLLGPTYEAFELLLGLNEPIELSGRLMEIFERGPAKAKMIEALRSRAKGDPRYHALLASALQESGDERGSLDAMMEYAKACEPWNAALHRRCVTSLLEQKRFTEAAELCRVWTVAEPQNVEAWVTMGDVWQRAGDEARAYRAYTSIADVRPGDADAHRLLGQALLRLNRVDEAIAAFEKSKNLRPEEPDRWIDVADATARKDAAAAEALFDEIAKRTWEARFGNVVNQIRLRMAQRYVRELEDARRRGDTPRSRELRRVLAEYGVPEAAYDLKVIVTWDTKTDLDLDVVEPSGEHIHHGHGVSKTGGKYWSDNTQGHGPETYTLARAPAGDYKIGAHLHSGAARTTAKFVIILFEDTDREQRIEHELVFDKAGEQKFVPLVELRR